MDGFRIAIASLGVLGLVACEVPEATELGLDFDLGGKADSPLDGIKVFTRAVREVPGPRSPSHRRFRQRITSIIDRTEESTRISSDIVVIPPDEPRVTHMEAWDSDCEDLVFLVLSQRPHSDDWRLLVIDHEDPWRLYKTATLDPYAGRLLLSVYDRAGGEEDEGALDLGEDEGEELENEESQDEGHDGEEQDEEESDGGGQEGVAVYDFEPDPNLRFAILHLPGGPDGWRDARIGRREREYRVCGEWLDAEIPSP